MITLDCYTCRPEIYEYARLKSGVESYPEWWKNLPYNEKDPDPDSKNMKTCFGFTELYKKSLVLPMWADFNLSLSSLQAVEEDRAVFADYESEIEHHSPTQFEGFVQDRHFLQLKLSPPWVVKSSKDISFLYISALWNTLSQHSDVYAPPGILNLYRAHGINLNLFFRRDEIRRKEILIRYDTPMVHIIPNSEERFKVKHHLVSVDEYYSIQRLGSKKLTFRMWDRKKPAKQSKCPFNFWR